MDQSICFIGAGNMAKSLMGGLIASGYPKEKIIATDLASSQRKQVTEMLGIHCFESNLENKVQNAQIIVLAVKPQAVEAVCNQISGFVAINKPLIISVVAAIETSALSYWLGCSAAIVRTMPNTPALIQTGATGLFANQQVSKTQKNQAEHILRAAGVAIWVDEETLLNTVTALSGSGPAYYFLFMEAMQQAAEAMGLDGKVAKILTVQTALGAAKMALESREDCEQLRKNVTSPQGTTEKAIEVFENADFKNIVNQAMDAAYKRAVELAIELGPSKEHK